jgi:pimeloyl-ACP methyl ester carboxylesterase
MTVMAASALAQTVEEPDPPMVTIDHFISHTSTVPANAGDKVKLFVREKVRSFGDESDRPVVLMIYGAGVGAVPVFDLQFEDYSWMEHLANKGFDVFALDFTGYGLSPRPKMDDPCNTVQSEQLAHLIPNPLSQPCSPSYPFTLTSVRSDWDEIDTVLNYIIKRRKVDRVNLVAWSRGAVRAGGYAARHPEKVGRIFLYAPTYFPTAPDDPADVPPSPGAAMSLVGSGGFLGPWDGTNPAMCVNQFNPAVRGVVTSTMLKFDPLGNTWGTAGVRRRPGFISVGGNTAFGWNTKFANRVTSPTLIIRGDNDDVVLAPAVTALFNDLGTGQKVFVRVACASHYMVWEKQYMNLFRASEEWLLHGTYAGQSNGSFAVDAAGQVRQEQ